MRAAIIGVVENEDVALAGRPVLVGMRNHCPHGKSHGADENWQAQLALDQRVACPRIVKTMAGIVRFGDDRVESRLEQGRVHLIGDLLETPLQDRQQDGIHQARPLAARAGCRRPRDDACDPGHEPVDFLAVLHDHVNRLQSGDQKFAFGLFQLESVAAGGRLTAFSSRSTVRLCGSEAASIASVIV